MTGTEMEERFRLLLSLILSSFRQGHPASSEKKSQQNNFSCAFLLFRVSSFPSKKNLQMTTCPVLEWMLKDAMLFSPCMKSILLSKIIALLIFPFGTMMVCSSWVFDSPLKHLFQNSIDFLELIFLLNIFKILI